MQHLERIGDAAANRDERYQRRGSRCKVPRRRKRIDHGSSFLQRIHEYDGREYRHQRHCHVQRGDRHGDHRRDHIRAPQCSQAVVTATVSYNNSTRAATLLPSAALANGATYTATVRGGATDPRVKDVAGNALTANVTWSFTTAAAATGNCPCSIWSATASPSRIETSDTASVEVGVRFRADVDGSITGLRFYKGSTNTGTHTGKLWTESGTLLATLTFTNETVSGWQQATFATPVAIAANTTYVASYHTNVGNYAVTEPYFTTAVNNAPLHALADGENGVYRYGSSAFPNQSYNASNYWVDVIFVPAASMSADATSVHEGQQPLRSRDIPRVVSPEIRDERVLFLAGLEALAILERSIRGVDPKASEFRMALKSGRWRDNGTSLRSAIAA